MALSLGVVPSSAASTRSGKCGKDLTYKFNGATGELVISGTGPMYDYTFDKEMHGIEAWYDSAIELPEWYDVRKEIKSIVMEEGVTSVGTAAFQFTENLAEVKFPKSLEKLSWYAFYGTGLKNLVIPETIKSICVKAFAKSALESVTLPKNINSVAFSEPTYDCSHAWFDGCTKLHTVVIQKGEKNLEASDLFNRCSSLKKVTVPDGVEYIDPSFFAGSGIEEIYLPASLKSFGVFAAFYGCENIKKIVVDPENKYFTVSGGALYSYDKSKLICVFGGVEEISLSSVTTTVYDNAFQSAYDLRKIVLEPGSGFQINENSSLRGKDVIITYPKKGVCSIKIDGSLGMIKPDDIGDYEINEIIFSGNISIKIDCWRRIEKIRCESGTSFSKPEGYSYNFHSDSFPDLKQIDVVDEEIDEQIWNMKGSRTDVIINFCCDTPAELMGDVNKDSVVDMKDCVTLIRATLGWNEPIYGNASDINGDGKYGTADVIMLIRKLVNN